MSERELRLACLDLAIRLQGSIASPELIISSASRFAAFARERDEQGASPRENPVLPPPPGWFGTPEWRPTAEECPRCGAMVGQLGRLLMRLRLSSHRCQQAPPTTTDTHANN